MMIPEFPRVNIDPSEFILDQGYSSGAIIVFADLTVDREWRRLYCLGFFLTSDTICTYERLLHCRMLKKSSKKWTMSPLDKPGLNKREIGIDRLLHILEAGCRGDQLSCESEISNSRREMFTFHQCEILSRIDGNFARNKLYKLLYAAI